MHALNYTVAITSRGGYSWLGVMDKWCIGGCEEWVNDEWEDCITPSIEATVML